MGPFGKPNAPRLFPIEVVSVMLAAVAVLPLVVAVTKTVSPVFTEPMPADSALTSVDAVTAYVAEYPSALWIVIDVALTAETVPDCTSIV